MGVDTKDVLIDVARTLFATKGYANTSMNDISNAANKEQYLVPYLMSSHPGSTLDDAIELACFVII